MIIIITERRIIITKKKVNDESMIFLGTSEQVEKQWQNRLRSWSPTEGPNQITEFKTEMCADFF